MAIRRVLFRLIPAAVLSLTACATREGTNTTAATGTPAAVPTAVASVGGDASPASTSSVNVGAILPLTGDNASFGTTARAAFEIAEDDARHQGRDVPHIEYGDSKLDKDLTLSEFRRLVDSKDVVAFVEVTGSGPALALEEIAAKDERPIVSGIDTSPALTAGGGPYFFRVIASDAYSSQILCKAAIERQLKNAALIFNQESDWAVGFKSAVLASYPAKGGTIGEQAIVTVTEKTVDFGPAIARLKKVKPQALFVGLMGRQAGLFVKQAVDKGLTGPFLGVDNLAQQEFSDTAGKARTRAILVLPSESRSDAGKRFEEAYRAKTGRDADAIAYKAYDSYMTVLAAIETVRKGGQPVTGTAVQRALTGLRLDGITGPISFDRDNDLADAKYELFTFDDSGNKVPLT